MADLARHLAVASEQLGSPTEVRQSIAPDRVRIDADTVVRNLEAHDAVDDAHVDHHRRRVCVTSDVRKELAKCEQHLAEDLIIVVESVDVPIELQRRDEAQTPAGVRCDRLDRRSRAVTVEARRPETEHGAAQAPDDPILTIDQLIDPELQRRWEELTECCQSHRSGEDLLDDAVVQITCDPLAFGNERGELFVRCHHTAERTNHRRADAVGGFLAPEEPTDRRP